MPPLSNTAGGRFFVKIDGQEILCDGIRLEDFAVLEKELLAQREPVDLLAMTADAIKGIGDAELQKSLYREALIEARRGQYVEINDILKWIQRTPEGFSLSLWLTLERAKPGKFTRDYLLDFVTKNWNSTELLRVAKDQADASGASDLGNSPLVPGAPQAGIKGSKAAAARKPVRKAGKGNARETRKARPMMDRSPTSA